MATAVFIATVRWVSFCFFCDEHFWFKLKEYALINTSTDILDWVLYCFIGTTYGAKFKEHCFILLEIFLIQYFTWNEVDLNYGNTDEMEMQVFNGIRTHSCHWRVKVSSINWSTPSTWIFVAQLVEHCSANAEVRIPLITSPFHQYSVFSVFTSHVIKIKIVTIQWKKSRVWDMIDDWYTNNLAKNQVSVVFHSRVICTEKCVT